MTNEDTVEIDKDWQELCEYSDSLRTVALQARLARMFKAATFVTVQARLRDTYHITVQYGNPHRTPHATFKDLTVSGLTLAQITDAARAQGRRKNGAPVYVRP